MCALPVEKESVAPDVLLAQGVEKRDRDTYLLWEEKPPALIFEITSRSTRDEDTGHKKDLYEQLGVAELVLFDPYGEYLNHGSRAIGSIGASISHLPEP
ncbi:MAG TPA: Uma2 family endonuclease [Thermoanaerobaculia bacterium]|jgi:Uma2 family endonuclease|nr:Uma2 family endonuclease [Thermoanaerobaculia bacterium]